MMDVPLLIAEVSKRPALWEVRHGDQRARHSVPKLWKEVAEIVGFDVDQCKRKWKNLRDAYRAEVRRSERRIERDKLTGEYDPNTNYNSKWVYFPNLRFIDDNKRDMCCAVDNENANSNSNDTDHNDEPYNESMYDDNFPSVSDIKLEPSHVMEDELHHLVNDEAVDDDETANDMLFEEFQNIATPQAARRLSATLSINNPQQKDLATGQVNIKDTATNSRNCKCSQQSDAQLHFLEDLGRQERKLIKSTRQDITRINKLDHIGDSDYNFLVSFLPQMKKMSELQNLQFRAKMCDMVLNIVAPSSAITDSRNSSVMQPITDRVAQQEVNARESENMINSTNFNNFL